MKRKFTNLLVLSLAFASLGFVSSCKDTEEDNLAQLNQSVADRFAALNTEYQTATNNYVQQLIASGALNSLIAREVANALAGGGYGTQGPKGDKGDTPVITIGTNGNWFVDGVDTGVKAQGPQGDPGTATIASVVTIGDNGNWFIDGVDTNVKAQGPQGDPGTGTQGPKGDTPVITIGENGNWFVDGVDTGVKAQGPQGEQGEKGEATIAAVVTIGDNGNWFIDGEDTNVKAQGPQGEKGEKGVDGLTPHIGDNGNWYLGENDLGVKAKGEDGEDGEDGKDGVVDSALVAQYVEAYFKLGNWQELLKELPFVTEEEVDAKIAEIEKCKCDFTEIMNEIQNLKTSLANLITGVIVQGTYNPFYGTFSLPTGVNSNVLVAYYGSYNGSAPLGFPTDDATHYLFKSQVLTESDWQMIEQTNSDIYESYQIRGGESVVSDAPDNAGTIYVTVNPNTVDFSGEKLTLVNSQDEESGIKLSALKASDKVLSFGYTRAADNGFYEANAHLDAADIAKVKINIEPGLKTAFKEAFGATKGVISTAANGSRSAIKDTIVSSIPKLATLAAKLYNQFNGILPAEAVKASYVDGEGETHSIYSNYGVAATAIKPLSFAFGKDFNYQTVPGYEQAIKLVNKIDKKIKDKVKVVFKEVNGQPVVKDIQNLKIDSIELKDLSDDLKAKFSVSIDTIIYIDGLSYHLNLNENVNVPVKFTQDVNVPIHIDKDVEVDLSDAKITKPTLVVTTDLSTSSGEAVLVVPVTDNFGNEIGNAKVPLDDINVKADAEVSNDITIDGTVVAHLTYDDTQTVTISVDQTVATTISLEKWLYFGDNGTDKKAIHLWVTKDFSDAVDDLWDAVKDQVGGVNDMLADLNKIVKDANALIDKLNSYEQRIENAVDGYANRIKNLIDKVNSASVKTINRLNDFIQPVMIVNANRLQIVSPIISQATYVGSAVTLHPTTFTAEIVTPCLKKHIAVTNVYKTGDEETISAKKGDGTCLSALKAANQQSNMNKVLNGGIHTSISLSGLKTGYTYEVAYSALDYSGNIVTRRYYIRH